MSAAESQDNPHRLDPDDAANASDMKNPRTSVFRSPDRRMHAVGQTPTYAAQHNQARRLRRTEDRLYRRELEFKTLVENSPDVISRIDMEMRHLYVNPAAERSFGIDASAFVGKTIGELGLPQEMQIAWEEAASRVVGEKHEWQFDYRMQVGGMLRHFSTRLIPEQDRNGHILSLLAVTYDITERTRMEEEREELLSRERNARIQAETAARARDGFLAIVSHELRAPLNGIQSWAHVLENYAANISPVGKRAIDGIRAGVSQQVRLIEDLLDATSLMSGKMRLVRRPMALLPALQGAAESIRAAVREKSISFVFDCRITREQIDGDPDRVQQIMWNLLSNAVKFTPEHGEIVLSAVREGTCVRLAVRDTGSGIAPSFMPRLFDRFSQQDNSRTRSTSGLGLGLFVVKHLVELHGGKIQAESDGAGQGSLFTVQLPLHTDESRRMPTKSHDEVSSLPSLHGLRILLIDDDAESRESLAALLVAQGADAYSVASGDDAIAHVAAAGAMPDLLICDIAMPGEDGYAVLRRLRVWQNSKGERPLQRLPALALTAFSQREDRLLALAAGFQMHAAKPVASDELAIMITNMAGRE